ncbi:MAG: dockerin type I domain-containing protein [Lachnospiraceae bacterium]
MNGYTQWNTDMIYFGEMECYGTPEYFVQKIDSSWKIAKGTKASVQILTSDKLDDTNSLSNKTNVAPAAGEDIAVSSDFRYTIPAQSFVILRIPVSDGKLVGDMNQDGKITAVDALEVLLIATATEEQVNRGDVEADGILDRKDALRILEIASGL